MSKNTSTDIFQWGTTVRFICEFKGFDGELVDPETVAVKIYDYRYNVIFEGEAIKERTGRYFFDYTTESKEQKLFYEWNGTIDSKPSIARGEFQTRFV